MPLKRSMRSLTNTLGKELFQEAEEWFFTANNESLYSFENICEYSLINSNYLPRAPDVGRLRSAKVVLVN